LSDISHNKHGLELGFSFFFGRDKFDAAAVEDDDDDDIDAVGDHGT